MFCKNSINQTLGVEAEAFPQYVSCVDQMKRAHHSCFVGLTVSGNKTKQAANGTTRQQGSGSPPVPALGNRSRDGYSHANGLASDSPPPEQQEMHRPPPGRNSVKQRRSRP